MAFVQAKRQDTDGKVEVKRDDHNVYIYVTTDGETDIIACSEYNASRIVGALSVMLGIQISKADAKAIKMT